MSKQQSSRERGTFPTTRPAPSRRRSRIRTYTSGDQEPFLINHSRTTQYLKTLRNDELVNVGLRLGLRYPTLKKMSPDSLLNDMVHAWLRKDDDVADGSGEPSWESLSQALEDCGHSGIAKDIKQLIAGEQAACVIITSQYSLQGEDYDTDEDPYENFDMFSRMSTADNAIVVKESKLMDDHESYHGSITGKEAEQRLKICGDHCYLTRYSEAKECYMLTIYKKQPKEKVKHFQIFFEHSSKQNVYKIEGKTTTFNGIKEMLTHYEHNRIDPAFKEIGQSVTERNYMEAKFTADKIKQQELEEALREAGMKYQQVKLQLEVTEKENKKLEKELQQPRRDNAARVQNSCCCLIL